jgi:5,6-dimethylbenzimidazole synthase
VDAFYPAPMLELEGWAVGRQLQEFVFENSWNQISLPSKRDGGF